VRLAPLLRVLYRNAIMGSVTLYCSRCGTGMATLGELPAKCSACDRVTRWLTSLPVDPPTVPYKLEPMDRRFLKSIRVAADDA
jgi:hypothetical protein